MENEGAQFRLSVMTGLRHRGVRDIFIARMDGLNGLPEAVNALFPKALTQLCVVHLVRASPRYVTTTDTKAVVATLKRIYQSVTPMRRLWNSTLSRPNGAQNANLSYGFGAAIGTTSRPFFQFMPEIRKVIYTTNAIESLNMSMRKLTRNRRIFPNDDFVLKALYRAINHAARNWKAIHFWRPALQSFHIMFGDDRMPITEL